MTAPYADEAPLRRVAPLLLLLVAVLALILAAAGSLQHGWGIEDAHDASDAPLRGPEPALETAPQNDLRSYLAKKEQKLDSTGWIDRSHHLARIPVAIAMRALTAGADRPNRAWSARLMGVARAGAQDARPVPDDAARADGHSHPASSGGKAAATRQWHHALKRSAGEEGGSPLGPPRNPVQKSAGEGEP